MERPGEAPRRRWLMIAFAFGATLVNYLDRQTLSVAVAAPDFKAAVPLTEKAYGYVGSAFMLAYAVSNGLSGPFIDWIGTRIGYAACMLWWSVAGILRVFARGALSLGCFRFLLGAGEAGNWPATAKLVGEWFPPRERALASGIFNSGASIGAVVATPMIASAGVWHAHSTPWASSTSEPNCRTRASTLARSSRRGSIDQTISLSASIDARAEPAISPRRSSTAECSGPISRLQTSLRATLTVRFSTASTIQVIEAERWMSQNPG